MWAHQAIPDTGSLRTQESWTFTCMGWTMWKEKHIQVMLILPQLTGTTSFFCVAFISTPAILKLFFPQRDSNFFFFAIYSICKMNVYSLPHQPWEFKGSGWTMANHSFSTKTNKAATQSKTSSIPASTAEKECKTIETRWKKADSRLKKCVVLREPNGLSKLDTISNFV